MHKLQLRDSDKCDRCRQEGVGFLYIAWECRPIAHFWIEVEVALGDMIEGKLDLTPEMGLLGYLPGYKDGTK